MRSTTPKPGTKSALSKLLERRRTIFQNAIGKEVQQSSSDHSADFLSQASLGNIQETSLALRDKQLTTLRNIDLAIERTRRGEYGICADCGEMISHKRLDAFPEVLLCLTCKEAEEATARISVPEPCPRVAMGEDFSIGSMMEQNLAL